MAWGISNPEVRTKEADIARLTALGGKSIRLRAKADMLGDKYVVEIYRDFVKKTEEKSLNKWVREVEKVTRKHRRNNQSVLSCVVNHTSPFSRQHSNRLVLCMELAAKTDVKPGRLLSFIRENGGLHACARKSTLTRAKSPPKNWV